MSIVSFHYEHSWKFINGRLLPAKEITTAQHIKSEKEQFLRKGEHGQWKNGKQLGLFLCPSRAGVGTGGLKGHTDRRL